MRKLLALLVATLFIANVYGQTEPKNYAQTIAKFTQYYNTNKPDSIYKIFGAEMRAALTPDAFRTTTTQLKAQLGALKTTAFTGINQAAATYDAAFDNGNLILRLSLNASNQIIGLLLQPAAAPQVAAAVADDPALTETPIIQKTFAGNISGTLTMPKNASGKIPVVLIIAGSGPTDRDGNSTLGVNAYTYKLLANALGKNGIASVRYDKRLVGKSVFNTKEKELRFEDYADDAIALVNTLHSDVRFSKVVVLGHSEGSLVGMLASTDQPVAGYISVAGGGDRADKILTDQMKTKPAFLADGFKIILDSLKRGKFTDKVDPSLYFIARPSVQPYLLSWMMHDPAREIKKITVPILILQGSSDLQIGITDAEKLKKANKDATMVIIPNMNHVLKEAPVDRDKNLATYQDPSLPIKPELVTNVVNFIGKLK